ncbi:hypothetical protein A4A49_04881 [Nicotiana attenuata]|uniref:Uncharacterized protein n=1 Tax=Nicotiana attenuata TaxID=49451 RepID=A0A314L6C9_NICAT|nr:hypothetical protein A4A49_04881 [Nicotiana attenuata]
MKLAKFGRANERMGRCSLPIKHRMKLSKVGRVKYRMKQEVFKIGKMPYTIYMPSDRVTITPKRITRYSTSLILLIYCQE